MNSDPGTQEMSQAAALPEELRAGAFIATNGEGAWAAAEASKVVGWLASHDYAVLAGEVWAFWPGGYSGLLPPPRRGTHVRRRMERPLAA